MSASELLSECADSEDLFEHFESHRSYGREYQHLRSRRHGVECGTVLIDDEIVRGYPRVPRTLVLRKGIPTQFENEFFAEEKLDGSNIRIAHIDESLAFTRKGYLCPYTTRVVQNELDLGLDSFFRSHPELMICGELVGPESPYTAHEYPSVDSLSFYAFDLRDRRTGEPLPVEERRTICESHGVPQVPLLGRFAPNDGHALMELVRELDREGREGIVLKSRDGSKQLKYTTSAANQGALSYAFSLPFEYGQEFVFNRIIREAFQSVEFEESDREARQRARDLGESILLPTIDVIQAVEKNETIGEHHTVSGSSEAIEALLSHLRDLGLSLVIESDTTTDGERSLTFCKRSHTTGDTIENHLDGHVLKQ